MAWIEKWHGRLDVVALHATTGWRRAPRGLQQRGIAVRLTDPGQASALRGGRKRAKNDRLDARWLVMLLARETPSVRAPCTGQVSRRSVARISSRQHPRSRCRQSDCTSRT